MLGVDIGGMVSVYRLSWNTFTFYNIDIEDEWLGEVSKSLPE